MTKRMKLLILNGDSTSNRGDRAILLGNILLLTKTFPEADIRASSYNPKRDAKWYGIKFYNRGSLTQYLKAITFADLILWGGGELIQDDTSRVKIPYWFVNILILTFIFRKKVIGLGQGLGPVKSKFNRYLSKLIFDQLEAFISRDNYSEKMIRDVGSTVPVINSHDPAILVSDLVEKRSDVLKGYLTENGFSSQANTKIIGVGVRRWFHQRSSWIPHKYAVKYALRKIPGEEEFKEMTKNLAILLDTLVVRYGYKVVFFPMYTPSHEADDKISRQVTDLMKYERETFVFTDDVSPTEYLRLIAGTDLFLGIRLHSTILSTSMSIPSLTFYYVPKGKSYFEQLGIAENSFPVEDLLSAQRTRNDLSQFDVVINNHAEYTSRIEAKISAMKEKLRNDAEVLRKYA
jgi:polysaccharide pyruvyl transferase WcaK-like protein